MGIPHWFPEKCSIAFVVPMIFVHQTPKLSFPKRIIPNFYFNEECAGRNGRKQKHSLQEPYFIIRIEYMENKKPPQRTALRE